MSSQSAVDVEVRLKLRDGASAGIAKANKVGRDEAAKTATAIERAAQRSADATEKSATRQRSTYERLSQARETLGVRSERAIQREIQQTEAAYNRLKATGNMSWREQAAAADKMRQKVRELNNEMGRLTASQKAVGALKIGAAGVAGLAAGAYTLKAPAMAAMAYDERLAHMANTAFSGQRDSAGRLAGAKTLEDAINRARKYGGGSRDQAAEALDTMISSNAVEIEEAMKILPTVIKQAKAANADPNEIALTAVRAMQTFQIGSDDIEAVLSGTQVAGQMGSFELKNMAKWLPAQMAKAKQLGITGKDGLVKLAAWNEASAVTAGTKDEAGNNLGDLLNELNSPHFRKFMSEAYFANGRKAKKGEKEQRMKDIDAVYLDYASRGIDKVSATTEMMEVIFSRDRRFADLKGQLSGLGDKDPKRKEILEAMAAQVQGVLTGKVFHNQQSLGALLGIMGNRDIVDKVSRGMAEQYSRSSAGLESNVSHTAISSTAAYKLEQAGEDKAMGQKAAMDSLTPAIGKAAEAFSDLTAKHPALVGTTTLATTALGALAGAAGIATLAMGGQAGGGIGRYAAALAGSGIGKTALRFGKAASIGGVGALAGEYALDKTFGEQSAISRYGSSALTGAAYGAMLGSVVPILGTGFGAAAGGALGLAGQWMVDLQRSLQQPEQKPVEVNTNLQVGLAPGLVIQSQSMQSSGGNAMFNASTGNLYKDLP